jgi:hypothetical protein
MLGWVNLEAEESEEVYDIMQDYIIWLTFSATPPSVFTIHIVPGYGMGAIVKDKRVQDEASFKELSMKNLATPAKSHPSGSMRLLMKPRLTDTEV